MKWVCGWINAGENTQLKHTYTHTHTHTGDHLRSQRCDWRTLALTQGDRAGGWDFFPDRAWFSWVV
jgi:hypothetical protein